MNEYEEMMELEYYLVKNNYNFERFIEREYKDTRVLCQIGNEEIVKASEMITHRNQIIVYENGKRVWDAICQKGSYGFEKGLIEIMGTIVSQDYEDDVEGYLTADEIINRLERLKKGGV